MKRGLLIGLAGTTAACWFSKPCSALPAQFGIADKASQTEINFVLRISRKVIDELTTKRIRRADPVNLYVIDTPIDLHGLDWTRPSVCNSTPCCC